MCIDCDDEITQIGVNTRDGNIHHLNGDVTDDTPENLIVLHTDCHQRRHPVTDDFKRRISAKLKGRPSPTKGMKFPNRKPLPWQGPDNGHLAPSHLKALERGPTIRKSPPKRVTEIRARKKRTPNKSNTKSRIILPWQGSANEDAPIARNLVVFDDNDIGTRRVQILKSSKSILNPFFGKHHTEETREKMRGPRRRIICDDCGEDWSTLWIERHKKTGKCIQSKSVTINGVSRVRGKLVKTECHDCGKPYANRWMQRHKNEGQCIKP